MESQVSCHEVSNIPENVFIKDVITSETHHVASNQPAKKQTRQWAAWTRQEEESFFNALRQVGKNFEKITSRVQSKNKDQVRHYYYRLVRRMNKFLGPELSLDAKNSKYTNAAMLRWWSLLEKHSCKASKLHLKPRKFKVFLETLEHQLLKDRKHQLSKDRKKTNTTKRSFQSEKEKEKENGCLTPPTRQSRKYKKWEKVARDGVSLVADAAAHLEGKSLHAVPRAVPPVPPVHTTKLKLQLFPINETIRKALETENHNPHLELTLSFRKKISSVLEHMDRKWGKCRVANGELTLLPFYSQSNLDVMSCQKWSRGSELTAGDVYAAVGNPSVFRLRYGWFVGPRESGAHKNVGTSILEWVDSLTNVSISDLLVDSSCNVAGPPPDAFSCDSFDAAIAAHISKNIGNNTVDPTTVESSILDAEETCDAFTFFKNTHTEKLRVEDCETDGNRAKDVHALTDYYWPDSLGGLEVELGPCRRYQSNEVILSESLGGLTRMLTSSRDAFQNCWFSGLDQREAFPC